MRTSVRTLARIVPALLVLFVLLFIFFFKYLTLYGKGVILHSGSPREAFRGNLFVQTPTSPYFQSSDDPSDEMDVNVPFFPFKDVLVRSVYYDDRPRDGHRNASVFITLIRKNVTDNNLIVGCQVGRHKAKDFRVNVIGETPKWRAYPQYKVIDH